MPVSLSSFVNSSYVGYAGSSGFTGSSGIVVSATAPSTPALNDLWLDIS